MYKWLNHGSAAKWYSKKQMTMEELEEKYVPYIKHEKPTQPYLILFADETVGYIQAISKFIRLRIIPNTGRLLIRSRKIFK